MKKRLPISVFILLAGGCNYSLPVEKTVDSPPAVPYVRGSLYAAAVIYPDGYDFRRDSLDAAAEICFFRDSSALFSIPSLPGKGGFSIDADMHRIRTNHLYSDFYGSDACTHIAKDGSELFSYKGRERILDLQESEGDIFTLASSGDTGGWTFRCNGDILCGRDSGEPVGGLYFDKRELCFSYYITGTPSHGAGEKRHYFVSNGIDSLLNIPATAGTVRDIRRFDGELNILCSKDGSAVWLDSGQELLLDTDGSSGVEDCRFIVADNKLIAAVTYILGPSKRSVFWEQGSWKRLAATELLSSSRICSVCSETPALCFAESLGGGAVLHSVHYSSSEWRSKGDLLMISPFALCCDKESFAIGTNDTKDSLRPLVIRGRDTTRYDFNGYFIHLALP